MNIHSQNKIDKSMEVLHFPSSPECQILTKTTSYFYILYYIFLDTAQINDHDLAGLDLVVFKDLIGHAH